MPNKSVLRSKYLKARRTKTTKVDNDDWKEDPMFTFWVADSHKGDGFSYCKVCCKDIISINGILDIKKHATGRKHKDNISLKALQLLSSLWSLSPDKSMKNKKLGAFGNLFDEFPDESERSCPYTYHKKWEAMPMFSNWLVPSTNGDDYAFCSLCSRHLAIYISGISALKSHASSQGHMEAEVHLGVDHETRKQQKVLNLENEFVSNDTSSHCDSEDNSAFDTSALPKQNASEYLTIGAKKMKVVMRKRSKHSFGHPNGYYLYKYQKEWESQPRYYGWLSASDMGPAYSFCKCCNTNLTITASGRTALDRHAFSQKHRKAWRKMNGNSHGQTVQEDAIIIEMNSDEDQESEVQLNIKAEENDEELACNSHNSQPNLLESAIEESLFNDNSMLDQNPCAMNIFSQNSSYTSTNKSYKYTSEWEKDLLFTGWLSPSNKGDDYAYCQACHIDIIIHSLGEVNLKIHALSKDHKQLFDKCSSRIFDIGNGFQMEILNSSPKGSEEVVGGLPNVSDPNPTTLSNNLTRNVHFVSKPKDASFTSKSVKLMSDYNKRYANREPLKYNPRWEIDSMFASWLTPSSRGENFAACIYCSCDLAIFNNGKGALEKHARTSKHKKNAYSYSLKTKESSVDNTGPEFTCKTALKSTKIPAYYNPLWETDLELSSWISSSELGKEYAYCKACMKNLLIKNVHKIDLVNHSKSRRHLRFMNLLNSNDSEQLVSASFLSKAIKKVLPRIDNDVTDRLIKLILDDLRIEEEDDLQNLELKDFENILKPIQARKLMYALKVDLPSIKLSDIEENNTDDVAIVENVDDYDQPCTSSSDLTSHFDDNITCEQPPSFDQPSEHILQVQFQQQEPLPSPNVILASSLDHVGLDTHTLQTFDLSNVDPLCLDEALSPPSGQSDCLPPPHCPESDIEMSLKKSVWVDDFCVPSERLTPEVLNLLKAGEKIVEPHLSILVRAFAEQIYQMVKKPHIDDLRVISRKVTDEFPSLQDLGGNCTYKTFFEKLKNRIYTLRKKKSASVRQEQNILLRLPTEFL